MFCASLYCPQINHYVCSTAVGAGSESLSHLDHRLLEPVLEGPYQFGHRILVRLPWCLELNLVDLVLKPIHSELLCCHPTLLSPSPHNVDPPPAFWHLCLLYCCRSFCTFFVVFLMTSSIGSLFEAACPCTSPHPSTSGFSAPSLGSSVSAGCSCSPPWSSERRPCSWPCLSRAYHTVPSGPRLTTALCSIAPRSPRQHTSHVETGLSILNVVARHRPRCLSNAVPGLAGEQRRRTP